MFKRGVYYLAIIMALSNASPVQAHEFATQVLGFHSAEENGIGGFELRPQSNFEKPEDPGLRSHTHMRIMMPNQTIVPAGHDASPSSSTNLNTPSSIACIYNLVPQPPMQPAGCNPLNTSVNPSGGGGAIALVDAYDDPNAAADLAYFSRYFGLPAANFEVVYAGGQSPYITGSRPTSGINNGWALEEALDIEWAHAMAPAAKIILVEAQSNSNADLYTAVIAAEYLVEQNGGGEISMSWGSSEFSAETSYDVYFMPGVSPANVVFVAASGDSPNEVEYPAASPYVIASGGTTINRNSAGAFMSETAWNDSAGGISMYEQRPSFQNISSVERVVGRRRGVPDVSLNANPNTGVAVYLDNVWYAVGGTSVASPSNAGIMNVADFERHQFPATSAELNKLYGDDGSSIEFRDITSANCGRDSAERGYDLCTGWGSLLSYNGK